MINYEFVARGQLPYPMLFHGDTRNLLWLPDHRCGSLCVAHEAGKVVGLLDYARRGKGMVLNIAWVHPRHRRSEIGKTLFALVMGSLKPTKVFAEVVTRRGMAFIRWAASVYSAVSFSVKARFRHLIKGADLCNHEALKRDPKSLAAKTTFVGVQLGRHKEPLLRIYLCKECRSSLGVKVNNAH